MPVNSEFGTHMKKRPFFLTDGNCEPAYENLRDLSKVAHHRRFVESLWATYAPYADAHFLADAKAHLQERFWEMYLGCTLIHNGYNLCSPSGKGPEFYSQVGKSRCWFEAIAPGPGDGPDSVPEVEYNAPTATKVPEDEILLRLRHAIREKYLKYENYLRDNVLSKSDAYVIAINSKRIRQFVLDSTLPLIVKAVFPFGSLAVSIDTRTGKIIDQYHLHRDQIMKHSGNLVSTNVFLDEQFSGISAIIYSSVDVANYPPSLGADFRLVHNPLANVPLDRGSFSFGSEYWKEDEQLNWTNHNGDTAYRDRE